MCGHHVPKYYEVESSKSSQKKVEREGYWGSKIMNFSHADKKHYSITINFCKFLEDCVYSMNISFEEN